MKRIKLTMGRFALVDDLDFAYLSRWKWHTEKRGDGRFYAARTRRVAEKHGKKNIKMHRVIMKTQEGMDTDHINGDGLDNRRKNLRICTRSINALNRHVRVAVTRSGIIGVSWSSKRKKWAATIIVKGTYFYLGYFSSKEAAEQKYQQAKRFLLDPLIYKKIPSRL
jgi:hypothetical protein